MKVIHKSKGLALMFGLFMALLVLGTTNHCAFEELFVSIGKGVFGLEAPYHLPNHLGSDSEHKHDDKSESHQHGQPHPLVILNTGKSGIDFHWLTSVLFPLTFLSIFALRFPLRGFPLRWEPVGSPLPYATGDPPGYRKCFINCLVAAPQAPPQPAYFF